jgi:hypothetical protein
VEEGYAAIYTMQSETNLTLDDGSRTEQHAEARYYRDSAGRVRAEWVAIGLDGRDRTAGRVGPPKARPREVTSGCDPPGDGADLPASHFMRVNISGSFTPSMVS